MDWSRISRHEIGDEVFTALAAGGGGPLAARQLADVEHSRHMLLLRGVVMVARRSMHPEYATAREAYDLLGAIQRVAPSTVDKIVRYPSVGAWARRTVQALGGPSVTGSWDGVRAVRGEYGGPAWLAGVAAAAATEARFPCEIRVPAIGGRITLPSLGQVTGLGGEAGAVILRSTGSGVVAVADLRRIEVPGDPHTDRPGWHGLRRLEARADGAMIRLLIDDLDPFRVPHPSVGPRLTAAEADRWQAMLGEAWELLVAHHAGTAGEIAATIRVLTPLVGTGHGQRSATSREAFGAVALSPPRDPVSLALTLAHEVQHAKLCALLDMVRLTRPDGRLYYAPWRDDPRPVGGLLQGTYAYLGVTAFWRRQRHLESGDRAARAHTEYARWRSAVDVSARRLLASGSLTSRGEAFVAAMAEVIGGWHDESVPITALAAARAEAVAHAARWHAGGAPAGPGE
jgi:HEXXH motif-containing protein